MKEEEEDKLSQVQVKENCSIVCCLVCSMLFSLRVVSCTFAWRFGATKTISDASCKKNLLRDKRMQEQK